MAEVKSRAREFCKVEGCTMPPSASKGIYGGLCDVHAAVKKSERAAARNGEQASPSQVKLVDVMARAYPPSEELPVDATYDEHEQAARDQVVFAYEHVISETLTTIDDVILEAEKRLGVMLRSEIVQRIIPQVEP